MNHGPSLFASFAFPPNALGYCGPSDSGLTEGLVSVDAAAELAHIAQQFEGAWPYLELIGGCVGRDPLDQKVVEAYWIGNELLDEIDMLVWGNSLDERFRHRAGDSWSTLESEIPDGKPNHAFHVFCAYPWVGLLKSGHTDQALSVIDQCRIRWGSVVSNNEAGVVVESNPLTWDGARLAMGPLRKEVVRRSLASSVLEVGERVALHWDYVCGRLTPVQLAYLKRLTRLHLGIANRSQADLAGVVEH